MSTMPTFHDFDELAKAVQAHDDGGAHEVALSVDPGQRELIFVCNGCETPETVWTIPLTRTVLPRDLANLWIKRAV